MVTFVIFANNEISRYRIFLSVTSLNQKSSVNLCVSVPPWFFLPRRHGGTEFHRDDEISLIVFF